MVVGWVCQNVLRINWIQFKDGVLFILMKAAHWAHTLKILYRVSIGFLMILDCKALAEPVDSLMASCTHGWNKVIWSYGSYGLPKCYWIEKMIFWGFLNLYPPISNDGIGEKMNFGRLYIIWRSPLGLNHQSAILIISENFKWSFKSPTVQVNLFVP